MEEGSSRRRSARIPHPKKRLKSSEAQDDESPKQAEAARKPQRKGNTGKLAGLIGLPLDVLFEIFGSLRPLDLLRLARTTKEFRRLLMHKSAISVWRSVLAQVPGLPECPPGMNEPQWVNLAFDPHCHFCFTPGVRNIEWRFRLRVCSKCAKEHLSERVIYSSMPYDSDNPGPTLMNLVPSRPSKRGRRFYMKRDYHVVEQEFDALEGKEARMAYIVERKRMVKEIQDHAILCEKWTETQSRDRSIELQHLRDERRLAITKKLQALGYEKDIESIKYPDSLDDHKLVKVPQRLTERIWGNIKGSLVEFMEEMRKKRLAREFKELIIKRKQSAVKVLRTFKNEQLPYTEIMPEGPDFCEFEPIKNILEQPAEVDVDETSFTDILPSLPDLIEEWRKNINSHLVRAMKRPTCFRKPDFSVVHAMLLYMGCDHDEIDLDRDATPENRNESQTDDELSAKLKLATTVFKCLTCARSNPFFQDDLYSMSSDDSSLSYTHSKPLFYPAVLGHHCLTRNPDMFWPYDSYDSSPDPTYRLDHYTVGRRKWNGCSLRLDVDMEGIVEAMLKVARMNSATTTPEDMDNLGAWFACLKCATPRTINKGFTRAYGWRDAVAHLAERHGRPIEELRLMTADEVDEARMGDRSDPDERPQRKHWLCTHCRDLSSEHEPDTLDNVKYHLQSRHDIDTPEINKDYYKKFSAVPVFPAPCTVVIDVDFSNIDHDSPSDPFMDELDMDAYMSDNLEFNDEYDEEFY